MASLYSILPIVFSVVIGLIYLGGAITGVVLGVRKAGPGAWVSAGAFGLLLCNLLTAQAYARLLFPRLLGMRAPLTTISTAETCCTSGLTALAALLLIASLVLFARKRQEPPAAQ